MQGRPLPVASESWCRCTSFRARTPTSKTRSRSESPRPARRRKPAARRSMILARVVGTVVATRKDPRLVSNKLLVARPMDPHGKAEGNYLVAVDTVDAGVGETVLIVSGSSARMAAGMKDCPVDAAIVGIVDHVEVTQGQQTP